MAQLEMVTGGSLAGPVQELGRWGILRLLPRWLGEQAAAGGRVGTWSDDAAPPRPLPLEQLEPAALTHTAARPTAAALRTTIQAWRAAERALDALEMGSRDRARLQAEVDALRATHHRLFRELTARS